jgi:Ala-tRNA(Pro) deacylase
MSFAAIRDVLHRRLELASEQELEAIFGDCEPGAVPVIGGAYNVPMLVDEALLRMPDLYFEGGDHEDLVHVDAEAFRMLVSAADHGRFAHPH